jgi:CRISPR-associated exonuclease Cas4
VSGPRPSDELDGYSDIEVPVSAIEHYSYCPRQCALIHVEQVFEENVFTVRGTLQHERADSQEESWERGVRIVRAMPLWSARLGLRGKADVVELRPEGPYPVEFKSGRRRGQHAELQLCAQALCLEEMFGTAVARGALFNRASRARHEVVFDSTLRQTTVETIEAVRAMLAAQSLPPPHNDKRCVHCSLRDACMPDLVAEPARLRGLQSELYRVSDEDTSSGV